MARRRKHPRATFTGSVTCVFADIEECPCEGRNISEGGALLHVAAPPLPGVGALVELRLESEETGPLPVIDAEVVRTDDGENLFAVRFINLDPARRAIIRRIVEPAGEAPPAKDQSAGTYSLELRGGRSRTPTRVFDDDELSGLVEASKTGEQPAAKAAARTMRDSGPGYSNIEDAVKAASAQYPAIGNAQVVSDNRLPDLGEVPVVKLGVGAIPWESVDPRVAVVLAKVDGRRTYEQVIEVVEDISPQQAAELLGDLLEHRIIGNRQN